MSSYVSFSRTYIYTHDILEHLVSRPTTGGHKIRVYVRLLFPISGLTAKVHEIIPGRSDE